MHCYEILKMSKLYGEGPSPCWEGTPPCYIFSLRRLIPLLLRHIEQWHDN